MDPAPRLTATLVPSRLPLPDGVGTPTLSYVWTSVTQPVGYRVPLVSNTLSAATAGSSASAVEPQRRVYRTRPVPTREERG